VSPADVVASIFGQLGFDLDAKLPNPDGLDITVGPPAPAGVKTAGRLTEIM
jgi:hypothetical protein